MLEYDVLVAVVFKRRGLGLAKFSAASGLEFKRVGAA
jgi:hypothetical protein